jgi:hypothetical protein
MLPHVMKLAYALCAALLLCATPVAAQPAPAPSPPQPGEGLDAPTGEEPRRVVVLLLAAPGVDAELADALTEVAIGAVAARGGISIVGKEEFQAQLGQGEERSLECVSSTACVGRVGVQLDVHEVIAGTLNRRGQVWLFNLNRIDIRTGELVGRAFDELEGDAGALAAAIQESIPALYEVTREPSTLQISTDVPGAEISVDGRLIGTYAGSPVTLPDTSPGPHEVRISAPDHVEWVRTVQVSEGLTLQVDATLEPIVTSEGQISPLLWIGAGTAAGGGLLGMVFGLSSQRSPGDGVSRRQALRFVSDREREAVIANIAFAVAAGGVVAAVVGLLLSDFGGSDSTSTSHFGLAPLAGGLALTVGGAL